MSERPDDEFMLYRAELEQLICHLKEVYKCHIERLGGGHTGAARAVTSREGRLLRQWIHRLKFILEVRKRV